MYLNLLGKIHAKICKVRKRRWGQLTIIFLFVLTFLIGTVNNSLKTTTYIVDIPLKNDITIALISDLHNSVFGEKNDKILSIIQESTPDLILITGDLLVSSQDDTSVATSLISNLLSIAPVYFSYGNHELEYEERTGENCEEIFSDVGADVLNKNYVDVIVNGIQLRIGGIYGYCLPEKYGYSVDTSEELRFMREFEDTDSYKILLSHLPYSWINYGLSEYYDIDLIFSGHVHGGQVRLPFIGGLWEPELGWFPGRCSGMYEYESTTVVLSRGLGSAKEKLPRWNNPPEVVIVGIK